MNLNHNLQWIKLFLGSYRRPTFRLVKALIIHRNSIRRFLNIFFLLTSIVCIHISHKFTSKRSYSHFAIHISTVLLAHFARNISTSPPPHTPAALVNVVIIIWAISRLQLSCSENLFASAKSANGRRKLLFLWALSIVAGLLFSLKWKSFFLSTLSTVNNNSPRRSTALSDARKRCKIERKIYFLPKKSKVKVSKRWACASTKTQKKRKNSSMAIKKRHKRNRKSNNRESYDRCVEQGGRYTVVIVHFRCFYF